ncbi:hypothetical protein [Streptomyces goshikiensis]|uniref:hypothetical protein n=1 Tax=Streptomyces goshikiensis TaxID=1942 RepID=UPI0037971928
MFRPPGSTSPWTRSQTSRPLRIPQHERDALIDELTKTLRDVEPFSLMVGSLLSSRYGVIADLHPDDQLAALHHRVCEAIRAVRGDAAVQYPGVSST